MEIDALIVKYMTVLSEFMRQSMRNYKGKSDSKELFNLTVTQLHYLHAIDDMEAPAFTRIVERFNVQKSTVTDIVNRLIKRNLVYKKQSEEDLRIFHLSLTKKGEDFLALEREGYYYFSQKMTKCLDDNEKKQFMQLLQKIVNEIE